jgi:putative endonuclease
MAVDRRRLIGAAGEELAAEHLARSGYRIIDRNFRTRFGELDLVALDHADLVFCEVKTRVAGTVAGPSSPLEAVGPQKRRRLRRMAAQWLSARPGKGGASAGLRYDAIGVTVSSSGELVSLEHIEDAF